MSPTNSRSILQFFRNLPPDIVIDILSRLPIRTILICKCVCRSWRDLIRTREFVNFHLSKSVPGIVISVGLVEIDYLSIFEFDDELGLEHHHLHYKPLTKIDSMVLTGPCELQCSVNGLLLLHSPVSEKIDALYICNPITREYIELLYERLVYYSPAIFAIGFGVSRMTSQHKVVRILHEYNSRDSGAHKLLNVTMSICLVYTLGTVKWRSITPPPPFLYDTRSTAVYLNGNLHWLVQVLDGSRCISCFDLETETFSTLSLPSPLSERFVVGLLVLGDCLCVSDTSAEDEVVIWLMKEYGDEKSWKREYVIKKNPVVAFDGFIGQDAVVHPIKVFKDGDILMGLGNMFLIYHSNKTKTIEQAKVFRDDGEDLYYVRRMEAMLHTSSFFSLCSFVNERVSRF